jgi:hypothetical protein
MSVTRPGSSRYRSLLASRRALARAAPLLKYGLFSVGVSVFLDQVRPLVSDAQFTWGERRVMAVVAVVTLGGFGLAGWVAGRLLGAAADLMEVVVDGAEAAVQSSVLLESQVVPALLRVAAAMERLADGTGGHPPGLAATAVRRAVQNRHWSRAEQLIQGIASGDPDRPALAAELARARQAEVDELHSRLDAARAAGDAAQVIDCRDALTRHLRGDDLHDLDDRVVRWLAQHIASRVQAGQVTPDLAALAGRVTDSFGDTAEGASLLAALPKLRRRAGLCPTCGRPRRSNSDACPDCRSGPTPRGASPGGKP